MQRRGIPAFERLDARVLLSVTIDGVQPVALQTPHLYALLRHTAGGAPLDGGGPIFFFDSLYSTASPGILISNEIGAALGVLREQASGVDAVFTHDHSQGSIDLNVSESLHVSMARFNPVIDPEAESEYDQHTGQKFLEIGPVPADPQLAGQNFLGPEATLNKVVVIDPKPANRFDDSMRTYVYAPGTPFDPLSTEVDPGIPPVSHHVQLSYGDYSRFTGIVAGAPDVPNVHTLVFVGPNPINPTPPDTTPPVGISFNSNNATGSFLLDTAATTSMISLAKAASMGVAYQAGTFGTATPVLSGVSTSEQFRMTVQSLDGPVTLAGFYLDTLTIQSDAGPIQFNDAPVLVGDVAVGSPSSPDQAILDGVLGMNLFSASAAQNAQQTIDHQMPGAFNWIVYDESAKTLGLDAASLSNNPRVSSSSFDYQGSAPMSLRLTFTADVEASLIASDLEILNITTGMPIDPADIDLIDYNPATETATFTFPGFANGILPDGNYLATLPYTSVEDGLGNILADDFTAAFFNFSGDANHDRVVNAFDFNALAGNFGGTGKNLSQGDVNYDGAVNTADFTVIAAKFNQGLEGFSGPDWYMAPGGVLTPPSATGAPAPALAVRKGLFGSRQILASAIDLTDLG